MRFLIAVCLVATAVLPSAAKDSRLPFKPVTGAFFAVSVPNMAESVQWYTAKLGLSVVLQVANPEVTVVEGGGLTVELIRNPAAQPGPAPPDLRHGVFKAGFLVKDFRSTVEQLRARGVTIVAGPFPEQANQRANVVIADNAGNLIQIFEE